jgi:Thiamine pyrophosphokinase
MITGDMDSIKENVLSYFKRKGSKIVETPDQNETDFSKTLRLLQAHVLAENIQVKH